MKNNSSEIKNKLKKTKKLATQPTNLTLYFFGTTVTPVIMGGPTVWTIQS